MLLSEARPRVVVEELGRASVAISLDLYGRVLQGMDPGAADRSQGRHPERRLKRVRGRLSQ